LPAFVLAHLSDIHLTPPPDRWGVSDVLSKRLFSRLSWLRARQFEHRREILDALIGDLRAQAPDHLAITGDLVNFAAPAEFEAAREWLESLGPASGITVSPGNHDTLVRMPEGQGAAAWTRWLGDAVGDPPFPAVRERSGVALVNACSSRPTPIFSAQGELGEGQLERLETRLAELGRRGLFRVLLIHHPIAPGVVSRRKGLIDAAALRAVLSRAGAELVLHGHGHEAAVSTVAGPQGPIPILGVPSASAAPGGHHPAARWRRIEIDPAARFVTVSERGIGEDGRTVQALGAYRLAVPDREGSLARVA
jgi:3',5'-cyclic AMP phosphodiesterase CpdA